MKRKNLRIRSAAQAIEESGNLPSIWSKETHLTQRILIYCAELLERQTKGKSKRKPTKWQTFLGRELKKGRTLTQAAQDWKLRTNAST